MISQYSYERVINDICALNWARLTQDELTALAWAYYFFSIQFRENLRIACILHPGDAKLQELLGGECDTDNLSPWPGVAAVSEKMNHDEYMRRTLSLWPIGESERDALKVLGQRYLDAVRAMDVTTRAISIGSYEANGLERVFRAFLTARNWDNPLLESFRHFLIRHIEFDSDPDHGHGALSCHLAPDDRILPLWVEFKRLLVDAAPRLAHGAVGVERRQEVVAAL